MTTTEPGPVKPGWRQLLKSVAGAFVGVQSEQQRQHDFQSQSFLPFLIAGIVATALFVGLLLLVVSLVTAS